MIDEEKKQETPKEEEDKEIYIPNLVDLLRAKVLILE